LKEFMVDKPNKDKYHHFKSKRIVKF